MNILFPEAMMVQLISGVQRERNRLQLYEMHMAVVGSRVSFILVFVAKNIQMILKTIIIYRLIHTVLYRKLRHI